jgi:hypothetical protein
MPDHLQPGRNLLQHLRDTLAEPRQAGGIGAAAAAGQDGLVHHYLARQVLGQWPARGRLALIVGPAFGLALLLRRSLALSLVLLEVADQHLKLVGLGRQLLGGSAITIVPQCRQLDLQLLDLIACIAQFGVTFRQGRVALNKERIALRQQGAQRLHIVRECRGVEVGGHAYSVADRSASPQIRGALPNNLGPSRPRRHAPVNPFQKHREHGWRERNNTARRLRPHEATFL